MSADLIAIPEPAILPVGARNSSIEQLAGLAVAGLASPASRRNYSRELRRFMQSGRALNREGVQQHLAALRDSGVGAAGRNVALAAIRLLVREAHLRGQLSESERYAIADIRGAPIRGARAGNWLDVAGVQALIQAAGRTIYGARNMALVACMCGCGLRREEVCGLTWEQWQLRERRRVWLDVHGKGGRVRTVPAPVWVARYVNAWHEEAMFKVDEYNTRPFAFSGQNAFLIVSEAARLAGLGVIRPHDLRRTYAKLSREGGAPIEQITATLGHASVRTTERYLGTALELREGKACADYIKI